MKPFFHRTTASGQGQTLPVLVVHANNMTHYAVLYVGLTRGQVSASCWCCARLVRIGGRCWLGIRVCVCGRQELDCIKLVGITSRAQFQQKLKAHPKTIMLLAATGRDLPLELVEEAIRDVIANDQKW